MTNISQQHDKDPKKIAAEKAVDFIKDGMSIGLGTGSTAYWAIQRLAEKIKDGLHIKAIASSKASEALALSAGIPLVNAADTEQQLDVGIDGADEVDPRGNLIKGGGGALVREKILASSCRQFIVIVDESKLVDQLGKFPVPVEIIPFAFEFALAHLRLMGTNPKMRMKDETLYITDNGNYIADCAFEKITDPGRLTASLNNIPGVVDNGIFEKKIVSKVIVGYKNGSVKELGLMG